MVASREIVAEVIIENEQIKKTPEAVIVISKFLKRNSKAKRRTPAYS